MVQRPPHSADVLPIVRLVREKVDHSELSLRDYAATHRIAYSTLRRYHDKNLPALSQPPRMETLRELARALDVPLQDIERAALDSLSYRSAADRPSPVPTIGPAEGEPGEEILAAIDRESSLIPEAREHLKNQLGLLLRLQAPAPVPSPPDPVAEAVRANEAVEHLEALAAGKRAPRKRGK